MSVASTEAQMVNACPAKVSGHVAFVVRSREGVRARGVYRPVNCAAEPGARGPPLSPRPHPREGTASSPRSCFFLREQPAYFYKATVCLDVSMRHFRSCLLTSGRGTRGASSERPPQLTQACACACGLTYMSAHPLPQTVMVAARRGHLPPCNFVLLHYAISFLHLSF